MDQKLLDALNNIGLALEELVDAINSKSEPSSATGAAIQSGNFSEDLKSINEGIKSIKADTQTIIENQQTIMAQGKEKESAKTKDLETDPKKEGDIKKGVGTILLIAVAVLAIGMAFKLVGDVNILSVIGLALGITLVAIAFEKVAQLKLDLKEAAIAAAVMVIMSVGLMISSHILNLIQPVAPMKMLTAIFISAGFALLGPSVSKLIMAFKGMSIMDLVKTVIFLPLILPAISLGIALASYALELVKPIGLSQFISSILISGIFVVLAFGLKKMMGAFKGIDPVTAAIAAVSVPVMMIALSLAIWGSSEILQNVKQITLSQFFTSLFISIVFVALSFSISKILKSLRGIDPVTAAIAAGVIPILMVAMSAAIWGSSEMLENVKQITLGQFFTSLFISIVFVALSFSISKILKSLRGIDPATAAIAAGSIPILMVAMSAAIWGSSEFLNMVVPITFDKFVSALLISIVFIGLSFAASLIIKKMKGIDPKTLATAVIGIPLLMVSMSAAIWLSSIILDKMTIVSEDKLINAGLIGAGLAILSIAMVPTIKILSKIGIGDIIKGALIIPILAAAVMVSSLILDLGTYENYPGLGWVAGVSLSLLTFGLGAFALGLAVFGPQALIFAAGLGAILVVAGTIVGVAKILSGGKYDNPGMLEWAVATSLLYATFTPIMLILGVAALASAVASLFGPDPWKMAQTAIEDVAKTIVSASIILSEGYTDEDGNKIKPNYKGGPTKEWAEGVSIALGAFSPIYGMLMKNAIFSLFGGGGVGPKEFTEAIETVSEGIVSAAVFFADAKNADVWGGHPTKDWAEGVGTAIAAFAPVFEVLAGQSWLSKSVSVEDMKKAILTISQGIVDAAKFFADPEISSLFNTEGNYPSEEWGKGVGAALNAFAPVFEALSGKSWYQSGDDVIDNMTNGIRRITGSLVDSARAFSGSTYDWMTGKWTKGEDLSSMWGIYPSESWAKGVGNSVSGFLDIFDELENRGYTTEQFSILSQVLNYGLSAMSRAARTLFFNKEYFDVELNPDFIQNIAKNVLGFAKLGLMLDEMLVSEKIITKETKGFLGIGDSTETESVKETKDLGIVDMVVSNLVRVARTLFFNKKYFEDTSVYDNFYKDVISPSGIIWRFSRLASYLFNKDYDNFYSGLFRTNHISRSLVRMARILYSGQEYFGMSIDPNYMKNVGQNILDFNELVKQLIESEGGKGFWDKVGDFASGLTGTDPISQIAKRMITLAEGYDKLAESLIKLGSAMKVLNITDIRMLGGLTPSLSGQKGGGKDELVGSSKGSFNFKKAESGSTVAGGKGIGQSKETSLKEDMTKIIKLLSNINKSTEDSSISLSEMLGQLGVNDDRPKVDNVGN